jgi:TRAP-type C4-dicarboxylate transport system substrate-binding protein
MRALGADPVNLPIGEVYSALAKGVIDGVVAPPDALRSLHLAEVGRYFTELEVPRGAYPARAISESSWRRLPRDLQELLDKSGRFWEAALETELGLAATAGTRYGREQGVQLIALPEAEQRAFDAIYNRSALQNAKGLTVFGVNGVEIFQRAQSLIRLLGSDEEPDCVLMHVRSNPTRFMLRNDPSRT